MNELLGKIHFFGSFICINGIFFPMFIQGLHGVNRRLYDGGVQYAHAPAGAALEPVHVVLGVGPDVLPASFIFNFFWSIWRGKPVGIEPLEGHDARLGGDHVAAARARQLRDGARGVPRAVRIQRARPRARTYLPQNQRGLGRRDGDSIHSRSPARHRAVQRQAGHVAVPGVRSDALRRAVLVLHPAARRLASSGRTATRS